MGRGEPCTGSRQKPRSALAQQTGREARGERRKKDESAAKGALNLCPTPSHSFLSAEQLYAGLWCSNVDAVALHGPLSLIYSHQPSLGELPPPAALSCCPVRSMIRWDAAAASGGAETSARISQPSAAADQEERGVGS